MKINQLPGPVLTHGFAPLVHRLILLHTLLVRTEVIDEEVITSRLDRGEKGIVAIWHQRLHGVIGYAKAASRYRPSAIISRSNDGDLISALVRRLHFRPIRSSSSQGGEEALSAIVEDLKDNPLAIHAVDGSRGPGGTVKAGLIRMAERSGAKIYPVYVSFSRAWRLRSWDRFLIPKPLSRIRIRWDQPYAAEPDCRRPVFRLGGSASRAIASPNGLLQPTAFRGRHFRFQSEFSIQRP